MNALLVPTEGTVIVNGLDTSDENNVWDIRQLQVWYFKIQIIN